LKYQLWSRGRTLRIVLDRHYLAEAGARLITARPAVRIND
jgi:hypothetical protein